MELDILRSQDELERKIFERYKWALPLASPKPMSDGTCFVQGAATGPSGAALPNSRSS